MAGSTRYRKLLQPGYIGTVRTRNRLLKMGTHPGFLPYLDGHIQPALIDYYEALARGGAGLVTVGGCPIGVPPGKGYRIDEEQFVPSMKKVTEAIGQYGCPAFLQVFHIGPMLPAEAGIPTVAASALSPDEMPIKSLSSPHEASLAEIQEIVQRFGEDAERARRAGFQGVEINAGCTHFLNTFLSRGWNKRQDEYSPGSLESRAKIVVDIIREIKKRNGPDFAVVVLINGAEPGLDKGITSTESQGIATLLQEAGADAIHIRAEFYSQPRNLDQRDSTHFPDMALYPDVPYPVGNNIDISRHGAGAWIPLAAAVKKVVTVPVIGVGRIDVDLAEKLLRRGVVDFVAFNRPLMADHELPNKLAAGNLDDIAPCTHCMTCFNQVEQSLEPRCRVNAALARGKEYEITPAERKKKVLVVGGGPAGMEAARVAALRGHEVFLYDKESKLGGSMPLAAVVKGLEREDLVGLVRYLAIQISKLGVKIRLGKEVNRAVVAALKPDVLVIAAGGIHSTPALPGIERRNVITSQALHRRLKKYLKFFGPRTLRWLTKCYLPLGKRVVIMGGDIHGCQTAEFLVRRGRKVTIVETGPNIGEELLPVLVRPHLLEWLGQKGVNMMTGVSFEEITAKGLVITDSEGRRQTIEADTILTALPMKPNTELAGILDSSIPEVYNIGDGREPHLIVDAIADAYAVAREI